MNQSTEEKYKRLTLRQRSYIDRKIKARKKKRKIVNAVTKTTWHLSMMAAFIMMLLSIGAIESNPTRNGLIMIVCCLYLVISTNLEERWKEEYRRKYTHIIPFPVQKESGTTKIS